MKYHRCSWCEEAIEASQPFVIVNDGDDRCCMDCWYNFGIMELVRYHGDSYKYVD